MTDRDIDEAEMEVSDVFAVETLPSTSTLLQIVPEFERIDGWLRLDIAELLCLAAASVSGGCIVEVGSYRGRSTISLAAGSSAGARVPVYAIEPHEHFVGPKGGMFGPSDRKVFFKNILATRLTNLVHLINTTSDVVARGWDKPVSLLYIDGDHRYDAVLSDFCNWRPHLTDGAIVIFNDVAGTGTALVIRDLVAEGCLRHVQTAGRLAMFQFKMLASRIEGIDFVRPVRQNIVPTPNQAEKQAKPSRFDEYVFYSSRGGYVYQGIPRSGQAATMKALTDFEDIAGQSELATPKVSNIFANGNGIFKFTMVRDPYERLASVYNEIFAGDHVRDNQFWVRQIADAAQTQGTKLSDKITFEEFVRVVAGQDVESMDAFWCPQALAGRFDVIAYDFVGRVEMITIDLAYVLERLGAPLEIMHRAIQPRSSYAANMALWSLVGGDVRKEFLKTFSIDFDVLRYPVRQASVVFRRVNVDNPKLSPFGLPKLKSDLPKRYKRKSNQSHKMAALQADQAAVHGAPMDVNDE